MALSARLEFKQNQTLVMTPQLQQAIKLLQFSTLELAEYIEAELERNPLLERADPEAPDHPSDLPEPQTAQAESDGLQATTNDQGNNEDALAPLVISPQDGPDPAANTDAGTDAIDAPFDAVNPEAGAASLNDYSGAIENNRSLSGGNPDQVSNIENYVSATPDLQAFLRQQLLTADLLASENDIAHYLIASLDDYGYLEESIADIAAATGRNQADILRVLERLQSFEPAGIFARTLEECLTLQLKAKNHYDPMIACLIEHLDLLAARRFNDIKKLCHADDEDLADMIHEIKTLDPRPGSRFASDLTRPVVPDVYVSQRPDSSWFVQLNADNLPAVLVNREYYAIVSQKARSDEEKTWLTECYQNANWLTRSLDQRARTILKVTEEIVRQQDSFLALGVKYLKPLNLKTIAEAIGMHESTVSRATANKFIATPRGLFEFKYFFSSSVSAENTEGALSSEAVRYRIKQLIDDEPANKVLSDDKIVKLLKSEGIDVARRTVAKYREAMRIPSSVQRRREKKMGAYLSG